MVSFHIYEDIRYTYLFKKNLEILKCCTKKIIKQPSNFYFSLEFLSISSVAVWLVPVNALETHALHTAQNAIES